MNLKWTHEKLVEPVTNVYGDTQIQLYTGWIKYPTEVRLDSFSAHKQTVIGKELIFMCVVSTTTIMTPKSQTIKSSDFPRLIKIS